MNNNFGAAWSSHSSSSLGKSGARAPRSSVLWGELHDNKSKPTAATCRAATRRRKGKSTTQLAWGKSQAGMGASCFARAQGQDRILLFKVFFSSLSEQTLPSWSGFTASIALGAGRNSGHIHNPAQHASVFCGDPTLVCTGQLYKEKKHLEESADS